MLVVWAGLVNWIATTILVEGELFRPVRERVGGWVPPTNPFSFFGGGYWRRPKVAYLVQCHLCTGTWVGFVLALVVPGPFEFFVLDGLLYKAVGHLTLTVANRIRGGG